MNSKMKTIIIGLLIIFFIPFLYKQFVIKNIITRVDSLSNNGFTVTKLKDNSGYLSTKKSYKIIVSNPNLIYNKYVKNLPNNINKNIFKKILTSLNTSKFEIDINMLNLPIEHKNAINIYLTSLPTKTKTVQNNWTKLISNFLKNKKLGENINLGSFGNITSLKLKNIDQNFSNNNISTNLKINNLAFDIKRSDFAHYNYAFTNINKLFNFQLTQNNLETFGLEYGNLKCNIDRKDFFTNNIACSIANLTFYDKSYNSKKLTLDNILSKSNTMLKNNKFKYQYQYQISNIIWRNVSKYYGTQNINLKNFIYKGNIEGIDKDYIKKLSNMSYQTPQYQLINQYANIGKNILNKGFSFNINDFEVSSVHFDSKNTKINLGQIKVTINLTILPNDINIFQRYQALKILSYIKMNGKIELSKKDFLFLVGLSKQNQKIKQFVKYDGNKAIFNISFKNKKLFVNNKQVL